MILNFVYNFSLALKSNLFSVSHNITIFWIKLLKKPYSYLKTLTDNNIAKKGFTAIIKLFSLENY
jgi:hypothetical protein